MLDDIFQDTKNDNENQEDSNMDWKKSGVDKHERLTLKVNVKEANLYNANKKRESKPRSKPTEIPPGFKKIRKKIRDSYDDEEDDDDGYILVPVFAGNEISSLEKALTPEEHKQLQQMENSASKGYSSENINIRQTVERDMNLQQAQRIAQQSGLELDAKTIERNRNQIRDIDVKDIIRQTENKKSSTINSEVKNKTEELSAQRRNIEAQKRETEANNLKATAEKTAPQNRDQTAPELKQQQDDTGKAEKTLPKIKNIEEKDNARVLVDEAEKDKKSVQKELEREQQKREEVNPVTKEKTTPTVDKSAEQEQSKAQEQKQINDEQQRLEKERNNKQNDEKTTIISEKNARDLILEKSGRQSKEQMSEKTNQQKERYQEKMLEKAKEREQQKQNQREKEAYIRQRQRDGYSR